MLGALTGDIVGSPYERHPHRSKEFPLFAPGSRPTDDTAMTLAVADALLGDGDFSSAFRRWFLRYPEAGYGYSFYQWAATPGAPPYGSFGNGSAMRVSPVAWTHDGLEAVLAAARNTALPTHGHPEGIKGAQATAGAILLARQQVDPERIRCWLADTFGYAVDRTVAGIRPRYAFDVTCQGSVPEALICALEATSFEDALRNAVSLGGDADTQAAIAGSVAEARFGVPADIRAEVQARLDSSQLATLTAFEARFR